MFHFILCNNKDWEEFDCCSSKFQESGYQNLYIWDCSRKMANVCARVRIFSDWKYNFCSSQCPGQIPTCKILFRLDILFGLKLRPCTPDSDRFSLTHSNLTHSLTHVLLCYNILICSSSKFKLICVSFLELALHKGLGTTCQISSLRRRVPCALAGCPVQAAGCRVVPASWYLCPLCALCLVQPLQRSNQVMLM